MLWPIWLGRSGSQLFVMTKLRYRRKYMINKPIYGIWKFLILKFSHFSGQIFQSGFGEAIYQQFWALRSEFP